MLLSFWELLICFSEIRGSREVPSPSSPMTKLASVMWLNSQTFWSHYILTLRPCQRTSRLTVGTRNSKNISSTDPKKRLRQSLGRVLHERDLQDLGRHPQGDRFVVAFVGSFLAAIDCFILLDVCGLLIILIYFSVAWWVWSSVGCLSNWWRVFLGSKLVCYLLQMTTRNSLFFFLDLHSDTRLLTCVKRWLWSLMLVSDFKHLWAGRCHMNPVQRACVVRQRLDKPNRSWPGTQEGAGGASKCKKITN